jgi:hypothetical protein
VLAYLADDKLGAQQADAVHVAGGYPVGQFGLSQVDINAGAGL